MRYEYKILTWCPTPPFPFPTYNPNRFSEKGTRLSALYRSHTTVENLVAANTPLFGHLGE
jgi:hypothetical protein